MIMTYSNNTTSSDKFIQVFKRFNVDEQLALLWFIYTEIGKSIEPNSTDTTTGFEIITGVVDQLAQLPREQQLQIQRDILSGNTSNQLARTYADLNSSNRLAFWYLTAQRMDNGQIVQVPSNYEISSEARDFLNSIKSLQFDEQLTFMRNLVAVIGASPKPGATV